MQEPDGIRGRLSTQGRERNWTEWGPEGDQVGHFQLGLGCQAGGVPRPCQCHHHHVAAHRPECSEHARQASRLFRRAVSAAARQQAVAATS